MSDRNNKVIIPEDRLLDEDDEIGVDWGDIGKQAFGAVHTAGGTVLSFWGAKEAAKNLEALEAEHGLLPDWAKRFGGAAPSETPAEGAAPTTNAVAVSNPDYVIVNRSSEKKILAYPNLVGVLVVGGTRFEGTGYKHGEKFGKRISFGYNDPKRIELVSKDGKKMTMSDVKQVAFCAGTEAPTTVVGDGEDIGLEWGDFKSFLLDPTGMFAPIVSMKKGLSAEGNTGQLAMLEYSVDKRKAPAQDRLKAAQDRLAASQARLAKLKSSRPESKHLSQDLAMISSGTSPTAVPDIKFDFNTRSLDMDTLNQDVLGAILEELDIAEPAYIASPELSDRDSGSSDDLYILGCDIVGAKIVPKKASSPKPKTSVVKGPKGPIKVAAPSKAKSPHVAAAKRADKALTLALKVATNTKKKAESYKASAHKTLVPMTKVHGDVVLGAGVAQTLTSAQKSAIDKHTKSMAKHADAVTAAKKKADKAIASVKKIAGEVSKLKAKVVTKSGYKPLLQTKATGPTRIHGDEIMGADEYEMPIVDELDLIIGEDVTVEAPPPGDSGDGGLDSGALGDDVPMPVRNQTLSQSDAQVVWRKVPENGVVYDGLAKGFPDLSVGSYSWFADNWSNPSPGGNKTGFIYTRRGTHFGRDQDTPRWMGQRNEDQVNDIDDNDLAGKYDMGAMVAASARLGFGPLIGNPAGELKNLQYAVDDNKWFWQSDHAPAWATAEADQALAELNKKTAEAAKAAADAEQACKDQEAAEQQELKDKQDAAIALAQTKADAEAAIAQGQLDQKQAVVDSQIAAAQAQLDLQQQAQEMKRAAAQSKLDIQQQASEAELAKRAQQADLEWHIAHPEATMTPTTRPTASSDEGGEEGIPVVSDEGDSAPSDEG